MPAERWSGAGDAEAKMVDLKFTDLLGTWQHVSLPLSRVRRGRLRRGARLRRLVDPRLEGHPGVGHAPDAATRHGDARPVHRGEDAVARSARSSTRSPREPYETRPAPRSRARAEEYLRETGIADTIYFGPECEFFIFDYVSYDLGPNRAHYEVDSAEGHWNSGKPGLGYTIREKDGYFPPAPHDTLHDLRTEMVLMLERLGIPCEYHHHEVATGGQCEIDMRFTTLTRMADQVMTYKYVVKNVARAGRQDRDVHAEADLRRQRLGHALPPVALEGRRRR